MGIYKVSQSIQEVYFGKTKNIQNIQLQFSKFRQKFINNNYKFSTKMNIDPELLAFNRLIEKEFGFKSFSLYIINDIYYNAFTIPIGLTPGKSMDSTSSGFKLKSKNGYTTLVCISTGLLLDKKFSDEEIFAILLHEIGHNFSQNIDKHSSIFFTILHFVNIAHMIEQLILLIVAPLVLIQRMGSMLLSLPVLNNIFISFGNHFRKTNKNATKTFDFLIGVLNGIKTIFNEKLNITAFFALLFSNISNLEITTGIFMDTLKKMTPLSILSVYLGYNGERISDNFATVYGYGPQLSNALSKMEFSDNGSISNKIIERVPLINNTYKLMALPIEIITTGFDCHPNTPSRINQQILYLQKEIQKDNLDPYVKECIIKDIKELQKGLEDNMFSPTQDKIKNKLGDPYIISRIYCTIMYKLVGGDIRDLLYTIDNHQQFEDAYEKYKKE